MPFYRILAGHSFEIDSPIQPGARAILSAGEIMQLTEEEAAQHEGKIEPFELPDANAQGAGQ